jgi:hypothetical protein
MIKQTRIFVPPTTPFDTTSWAETLFGHIIRPTAENASGLNWFWFSRHDCPANVDSDDCNIAEIPSEFLVPVNNHYRSVRFRYSVDDEVVEAFETSCDNRITENGCWISDFRNYDVVADLGSNRHIGGDRSPERRQHRAELIAMFYYATCRLALDALVGADEFGRFFFEYNDSSEIPLNSSFETPHHIFCNITDVPLRLLVSRQGIGTDWSPPPNPIGEYRVRF